MFDAEFCGRDKEGKDAKLSEILKKKITVYICQNWFLRIKPYSNSTTDK